MTTDTSELRRSLEDPQLRATLTDILGITHLLSRCVIDKNYRISDQWTRPIQFTALGAQILDELTQRYKRIKPNDAKMAVFLQFECPDGLLVDLSTDLDALRQQLSREILTERIRYPYIFGRELHDIAAELYPTRTTLDNVQTLKVLAKLPVGIFQYGRIIVGPYGCIYSDVPRLMPSSLRVPGYLCPNPACSSVHGLQLETATSSISKARSLLSQLIIKNHSGAPDDSTPLISDAVLMDTLPLNKFSSANLFDVLSDGLNEDELRITIGNVLRRTFKTDGRRLDVSRRLGAVITNPNEFVREIERPRLMHVALLHSDSDIVAGVDEAIQTGQIDIEDFEARVSKLRRWDRRSRLLRAEIGRLGVRFVGPSRSSVVTSRMLDLLHSIYYESGIWDAADLAYALDAPSTLSDEELLDKAVRDHSPSEFFTRLVLQNRRTVALAAEKLDMFGYEALSRDQLLSHLQWKIGEPSAIAFTDLRRAREHLAKLQEANSDAPDVDTLRSHTVNLFTAIEDALNRALTFSVWALTTDHYLSSAGFEYDPLISASVFEFIENKSATDDPALKLNLDGRNSLNALASGFGRYAKALGRIDRDGDKRPAKDIPARCEALSRPFAYIDKTPFLNMSNEAQEAILRSLQSASRSMQNEAILNLRNSAAHGNRNFPTKEAIDTALLHVVSLIDLLDRTGLYPRIYELIRVVEDGIGRQSLIYMSEDQEVVIRRPGWAIAPRLPLGMSRLVIIEVARTISSGPLRFTLKPRPGPDPYWEGWPKRWTSRSDYRDIDEQDEQYEPGADLAHSA